MKKTEEETEGREIGGMTVGKRQRGETEDQR
jgi:hypothetical protein